MCLCSFSALDHSNSEMVGRTALKSSDVVSVSFITASLSILTWVNVITVKLVSYC
jgi:hypothetical protein